MLRLALHNQKKDLKDILVQHCQKRLNSTGLLLLTLPTGFGKTYYVLNYIAYHLRNECNQRIWFITNLKKNLPLDDLKEMIGNEIFNQHVVFLNSYSEQVQNFFGVGNDVDESLKGKFKSYHKLRKAVDALSKAPNHSQFRQYLHDDLVEKERVFRQELKIFLKEYFPPKSSFDQRLDKLRSVPELRWVEKLYPSVQYFEKKVFFCSIDKFYRYADTIIGPNIHITIPAYIKDNIVFIDEFDATKANIKNAIIDNAIQFNQDIITLFTTVLYGLSARPFPENRIKKAKRGHLRYLKRKFRDIKKTGKELYENHKFRFHYYFPGSAKSNRAFLFHDFEYQTIFDGQKVEKKTRYLTRNFNPKEKTNFIGIEENQPIDESKNLLFVINQIRGFIHLFSYFINDFARVYKEVHDKDNQEEISIENAIKTTLDLFDVKDGKTQGYFIDHIFHQVHVTKSSISTQFDLSPVNKGFRFYNIVNRKQHDATTHILYADTLTTPETWLINLCQHATVIGVSATAGFDSPISNYSLTHLKHHLGEMYHEISTDDKELLKQEFESKNLYSKRRKIKPISINVKSSRIKSLGELFIEKEMVNHFLDAFSSLEDFQVQRYIKTGKSYLYFLQNRDIHSFLCMLNKFPKEGKLETFQESILKDLFIELRIMEMNESEKDAKKAVHREVKVLNSKDFDTKQQKINKYLEAGERVFVISTYQTIGAGQNIQYQTPDNIPAIKINNIEYGKGKKDYDAIYLEKPTYLLHYFPEGSEVGDYELLDYLFEVEYLTEGGAINQQEKRERIQYAFRRRHHNWERAPSNQMLYQRRAVALHYCRVILQAVGRLSRTKLKSPITHLLYDSSIKDYLRHFRKGNFLLVKEFEVLHQHCLSEVNNSLSDNCNVQNINIFNSFALATMIRRLVRKIPNWNNETINFWGNLRRFVLCHPTISKDDLAKSGLYKFYLQTPEGQLSNHYFFRSEDDFHHDLQIDFEKRIGKEVSAEGAYLPKLLDIDLVKECFEKEENNFAMSFIPNQYILSPPLFQNVYLGALGEEIGSHILKHFGIYLQKMEEEEYELFDFKISNKIYIDFKFWGPGTLVEAEVQKKKIRLKMEKVSAVQVLIINIIRPNESLHPVFGDDGIVEVPGIICLEEKKVISESIQFIHQIINNHA